MTVRSVIKQDDMMENKAWSIPYMGIDECKDNHSIRAADHFLLMDF